MAPIVPFHPRGYFCDKTKLHQLLEHNSVCATLAETYSASQAHVKDAVYNVHDPAKLAADQVHLTQEQQDNLAVVFFQDAAFCFPAVLVVTPNGCYTLNSNPEPSRIMSKDLTTSPFKKINGMPRVHWCP
jgi:hypothetical protein